MTLSRRQFMQNAQAVGLFYAGLGIAGCATAKSANPGMKLVSDPDRLLDLPAGFSYTAFGETGGTDGRWLFPPRAA